MRQRVKYNRTDKKGEESGRVRKEEATTPGQDGQVDGIHSSETIETNRDNNKKIKTAFNLFFTKKKKNGRAKTDSATVHASRVLPAEKNETRVFSVDLFDPRTWTEQIGRNPRKAALPSCIVEFAMMVLSTLAIHPPGRICSNCLMFFKKGKNKII